MSAAACPAPVLLPKARPSPQAASTHGASGHQEAGLPGYIERKPISRGQREFLKLIDYYERRNGTERNHPSQKHLRAKLGGISNGCLGNYIRNSKAWNLLDVKQGGDGKKARYSLTAAGRRYLESGELSGKLKSSKRFSIQPEMKYLEAKTGELKRPSSGSSGFKTSNPSGTEVGSRTVRHQGPEWISDFPQKAQTEEVEQAVRECGEVPTLELLQKLARKSRAHDQSGYVIARAIRVAWQELRPESRSKRHGVGWFLVVVEDRLSRLETTGRVATLSIPTRSEYPTPDEYWKKLENENYASE